MNINAQIILFVSTLGLVACSISNNQPNKSASDLIQPSQSASIPISEQRLAVSEFKSQGVRIYYSLFGDVEAIETTGYAAVWGNSPNAARESYRVAELEAKKSLSDFINKETVTSTTSVRMISQNLEQAQDKTSNKFANNQSSNELIAVDTDLTAKGSQENIAVRNNALKIASTLQTTIRTQNTGILGGLYLKESAVIDGGRSVKVVMRWDKKHNDSRKQIRNLMSQ
jgi:hypothetical protein